MIDLNLNPTKRELRTFSLCLAAFLALVGWIVFHRTGSTEAASIVFGLGVLTAVCGLAWPLVMRPLFIGVMIANYPIAWVSTHVIVAFIFYCVVTPVGVIMRLTGRDPMERMFDRGAKTYWKPRRTNPDAARYFRQF
jgi:Saxitoxin biosynthesis operon protein SxtJ